VELKYKSVDKGYSQSFYLSRETNPYLGGNWHYHEDFELIYIIKGEGVRIVGDSLSHFRPVQLVLVGSWLPHLWKNDELHLNDDSVDRIVIKFTRLIGGQDIFSIPEFEGIVNLLSQSQRGLIFGEKTISKVHKILLDMSTCDGATKIINLQLVLKILSENNDYNYLASQEFTLPTSVSGENRLSRVINYISENFTNEISLVELARVAAMTPSSLCRFFKNRTNKTVFQFINEFRIGKACQMLISGNLSITEICFNSGFNSLTSFNRVFKDLKKVSPRKYKENYNILKM
jgi:AraC-like DNA-binding protein